MKFSPISLIPEQKRATTPDIFITDQYGKQPALHGDGKLTINQAIRLSKIINRLTPAFHDDNSIISGFTIDDVKLDNDDLKIKIDFGSGIISQQVFKIPNSFTVTWSNFKNVIPPAMDTGRLFIYFGYKDSITNVKNRPYDQTHPLGVANIYPGDQSTFDPISINGIFYNDLTKTVTGVWDPLEIKILITAAITYIRYPDGSVEINYDSNYRDDVTVIYNENEEIFKQQNGGYNSNLEVDGGAIAENTSKKHIVGINVLLNELVFSPTQQFYIPKIIKDYKDFLVFNNGIKYSFNEDWEITNENNLLFKNNISSPLGYVYAFENIQQSVVGCLKTLFSSKILVPTTTIELETIDVNSYYLIFKNGLLLNPNEYSVEIGKIIFHDSLNTDDMLDIIKIIEGVSGQQNVEIIFNNLVTEQSFSLNAYKLNSLKNFLVFYNGVLYLEDVDYYLSQNTIIFRKIILTPGNYLLIIGI